MSWCRPSGSCLQSTTHKGARGAQTKPEQGLVPDCLQPSLLRRSGFRQQVKPSVSQQMCKVVRSW